MIFSPNITFGYVKCFPTNIRVCNHEIRVVCDVFLHVSAFPRYAFLPSDPFASSKHEGLFSGFVYLGLQSMYGSGSFAFLNSTHADKKDETLFVSPLCFSFPGQHKKKTKTKNTSNVYSPRENPITQLAFRGNSSTEQTAWVQLGSIWKLHLLAGKPQTEQMNTTCSVTCCLLYNLHSTQFFSKKYTTLVVNRINFT